MKVRERVTSEVLADEEQVFALLVRLTNGGEMRYWEVVYEDGAKYLELTLEETP